MISSSPVRLVSLLMMVCVFAACRRDPPAVPPSPAAAAPPEALVQPPPSLSPVKEPSTPTPEPAPAPPDPIRIAEPRESPRSREAAHKAALEKFRASRANPTPAR